MSEIRLKIVFYRGKTINECFGYAVGWSEYCSFVVVRKLAWHVKVLVSIPKLGYKI